MNCKDCIHRYRGCIEKRTKPCKHFAPNVDIEGIAKKIAKETEQIVLAHLRTIFDL